jgi:hypothetical protein
LPENAKENDVYKLSETIYEEGMYYIPMDMGSIGESDGIIRYYFDSVFGSDVIDVVTQMVEDGKINNFALFDGDVRFDIPLVGAGYYNGFYIDSTKKTYDYGSHHFKYILVPSEYGDDFFYGRNAVKFHKGELVVFTDKGWVSADAETLKNIRYDLDDFKTEVGERFNSIDESYATINLENVSKEDFKRKAEEAGVGGDNAELLGDAPMVFKGFVDALPKSANEGEAYKTANTTIANREKINTFDCSNYGTTIYKDRIMDAYSGPIYEAIQNAYYSGNSNKGFVLVENGKEFTIVPTGFGSEQNEYVGTIFVVYGATNVDDYHTFESGNVDLYMGDVNSTVNLYVRHNGEWV